MKQTNPAIKLYSWGVNLHHWIYSNADWI